MAWPSPPPEVPAATASLFPVPSGPSQGLGVFVQGQASLDLASGATRSAALNHAEVVWQGDPAAPAGLVARIELASAPRLVEGFGRLSLGWLGLSAGILRFPLGPAFNAPEWDLSTVTRPAYLGPDDLLPGRAEAWTGAALQLDLTGQGRRLLLALGFEDAAARLEFEAMPGVTWGAHYVSLNPFYPIRTIGRGPPMVAQRALPFYDRWGADTRWEAGPLTLSTEYQYGSNRIYTSEPTPAGVAVLASGVNAEVAWEVGEEDQVVARYEHQNPFEAAGRRRLAVLGWNHLLPIPGARLQVQVSRDLSPDVAPEVGVVAAIGVKR